LTVNDVGFSFELGTKIIFGSGKMAELGQEARAFASDRVLIVADPGIVAAGLSDKAIGALGEAGLESKVFVGISANPRDEECCAAAAAAIDFGAQVIIGLGGGSALDAAKAAAALVTNGGRVKDWEDPRRLASDPLPLIAVPTTAGTGSEVTWVAVITDEEHHYKMTLLDQRIAPEVAVLDPDLTLSLPPGITAATGMDALVHAIEAYTCKASNPISDALALRAVALVAGALPVAVKDGSNREARSDMLLASLLAGLAFGNADVGAVHCLGESLGGLYDTPHGVACAVFLPYVLEFNLEADPAKHATIARALKPTDESMAEVDAARHVVEATRALMDEIGIPSLRELRELSREDIETIARLSAEHVCSPDNARDIGYDDYLELLVRASAD
jgi:alcohol dehydrogenase